MVPKGKEANEDRARKVSLLKIYQTNIIGINRLSNINNNYKIKCLNTSLAFRLSFGIILWKVRKESVKAFKVYSDLVKDVILLLIILHGHGIDISIDGLTQLANLPWTFATTVSKQFR